jgi:hypothetical protein
MTHGSLFSGIGGFDLAAEWMGWENKFHCEINPFGQRVLKYYWPNAISYYDIKQTDFTIWRGKLDILTGGFPCQPYSTAGKRKGKEDDRHLWPEMLRAIREIQPRWIVGENVRGLTNWNGGLVFDEVQADLEAEGYEVLPFLLPAAGVGAPHRRIESGLLPTAQTQGLKVCEAGKTKPMNLSLLPTPAARDFRSPHAENSKKFQARLVHSRGVNLVEHLQRLHSGKTSQLNPPFVAEMMGFPTTWTLLPFLINPANQKEQEYTASGETKVSKPMETQ